MKLTKALDARAPLFRWSQRAKAYADENFNARVVAQSHIDLYRDVMASAELPAPALSPLASAT